jgi:hypothetical protein
MGFNRNRDRDDAEIKDFRDPRVCKFYLLGMCPHGNVTLCLVCRERNFILISIVCISEMFVNTKADCGPCQRVHSEPLTTEFERNGDPGLFDNEVERDFLTRIADIDRTIKVSPASPIMVSSLS